MLAKYITHPQKHAQLPSITHLIGDKGEGVLEPSAQVTSHLRSLGWAGVRRLAAFSAKLTDNLPVRQLLSTNNYYQFVSSAITLWYGSDNVIV